MADEIAHERMLAFAERTGLTGAGQTPIRYLWTDAFAVCNFVGRFVERADEDSLRLALRLVDQTHHVLGRHRPDDARTGWISGLPDAEGEIHPTRGGLRIGKPLPERAAGAPADPAREWDRDGQYFHYLTRWMHALARVAHASGEPAYQRFACELAHAACAGFLRATASGAHLFWKMSIDLSRPLVASEGQHDPLDGFLTCCELQAGCGDDASLDLSRWIRELAALCRGRNFDTGDPLGIGGLLCDAHRVAQLAWDGTSTQTQLLEALLRSALHGLRALCAAGDLEGPAEGRLAFRELGLSIGLHAAERLAERGLGGRQAGALLDAVLRHRPLAARIERFWLEPSRRNARAWREHRDINDVMLATSLAPEGYLTLGKA